CHVKTLILSNLALHTLQSSTHFLHCFLFIHPASTEIYPLSLHDALPISTSDMVARIIWYPTIPSIHSILLRGVVASFLMIFSSRDRKSTRLNSSHEWNSYAVFCLKKQSIQRQIQPHIKAVDASQRDEIVA